jgi:hypothetical protein
MMDESDASDSHEGVSAGGAESHPQTPPPRTMEL